MSTIFFSDFLDGHAITNFEYYAVGYGFLDDHAYHDKENLFDDNLFIYLFFYGIKKWDSNVCSVFLAHLNSIMQGVRAP